MEKGSWFKNIKSVAQRAGLASAVVVGAVTLGCDNSEQVNPDSSASSPLAYTYQVPNNNRGVDDSCHLFGSPNWVEHEQAEWDCHNVNRDPHESYPSEHVYVYGNQGEEIRVEFAHFEARTIQNKRYGTMVTTDSVRDLEFDLPYGGTATKTNQLFPNCAITVSNTDSQPQVAQVCE